MSTGERGVIASVQADGGLHLVLRFALGTTLAFVACEAMQWQPTFLAPVLAAVLLANLPQRPTATVALLLVVAMAVAAFSAFILASVLRDIPVLLFALVALCMFLAFFAALNGGPALPLLLLLICMAVVPVAVMVAPAAASALPWLLVRSIVVALVAVWLVHLAWPQVVPPVPKPPARAATSTPLVRALLSTVVVMPVMLVYLMFGLVDVLPVLVATVMLVVNFDPRGARGQAAGMVLGNLVGGLLGLLLHAVLLTTPNLVFLGLLLTGVLLMLGRRIAHGGPMAGLALVTTNAMLIILGSSIASGPASLALWIARLSQFVLAGAFAVAMMALLLHMATPRRPPAAAASQ